MRDLYKWSSVSWSAPQEVWARTRSRFRAFMHLSFKCFMCGMKDSLWSKTLLSTFGMHAVPRKANIRQLLIRTARHRLLDQPARFVEQMKLSIPQAFCDTFFVNFDLICSGFFVHTTAPHSRESSGSNTSRRGRPDTRTAQLHVLPESFCCTSGPGRTWLTWFVSAICNGELCYAR